MAVHSLVPFELSYSMLFKLCRLDELEQRPVWRKVGDSANA